MMKMTGLFLFILLAVMLHVGCKPKKLETVKLTPIEFITKQDGADDDAGPPCCQGLQGWGLSCATKALNPDPVSIWAGYHNYYEKGTQPCACWHWHDCVWRGYVRFDLSNLPGTDVVQARLLWTSTAKVNYPGIATNETWCPTRLYVAEEPWGPYKIKGEQIGSYITSPTSVQVGAIVRDWVKGNRQNYGFFFVGQTEEMLQKSNQECWTQIYGLALEVTASK